MVKLSVDVTKDTYERLGALSDSFGIDKNVLVSEILDSVSFQDHWIIDKGKEYNVPRAISTVLHHIFNTSFLSSRGLFNGILELLEAKGRFIPSDMDFDLDEMSIWINYAGLTESDLYVSDIDVTLSGLKRLSASFMLELDRIDSSSLEKMHDIVKNLHETPGIKVPDFFHDVMEHHVDFIEDDDEFGRLTIDIVEESMGYLPAMPVISDLFKQIMDLAGTEYQVDNT